MGGSRKGKRPNGKGKSKSNKSDTIGEKPEKLNSKHDLGQATSKNIDFSKGKSKSNKSDTIGKKPEKLNSKHDLGQATSKNIDFPTIPYVECELEEILFVKIEELYKTARQILLALKYSTAEVETAILNAGHIHGRMDLLSNIVLNSISFLKYETKPVGEAFKNMYELHKTVLEALVDRTMQNCPNMNRVDAMRLLIATRWDHILSVAETYIRQSCSHCVNGNDGGGIEAFAAAAKREISALIVPGGKTCEDPECALVGSEFFDSIKEIKNLQEERRKQKDWAQRKVMDSEKRLSEHFSELQMLRMEKKDREKMKTEKICSKMSAKLLETEQALEQANSEATLVNDAVKRMEIENGRIKAEITAFNLNASKSERELKKVLKSEKKYTKKIDSVEKQASVLLSQCDEEEQRVMQLEQELFLTEKEANETEAKWRQQIKEKEEMLALLAQETKKAETQKARASAQLQKLREQVMTDSQLANDKCQRLENELSHLRESHSRLIEESSALSVPSHWVCMICMQKEVSVVFLPCTHQVVCFLCYLKKCQAVGACCPYCGVGIEDVVKVYGRALD